MKFRRLTKGEAGLAAEVFGQALDARRLRILTAAPTGGWAMVIWRLMLFPTPAPDFSGEPIHRQAWFVHELTHAWQFQHRPLRTLASWAKVALTGGYLTRAAYRYALPLEWEALNLEQQAKAVEHAFLLGRGVITPDMPEGAIHADYRSITVRASP